MLNLGVTVITVTCHSMISATTASIISVVEIGDCSVLMKICITIWASFLMNRASDTKGEPMNDLISRQAAIDAINSYFGFNIEEEYGSAVQEVINGLPSAQPQRMRGRWKRTYLDHEAMGERPSIFYCSACNQCIAYPTNYCPSCGTDMRGEQDEH